MRGRRFAIYLTADVIGLRSGGGQVTGKELAALNVWGASRGLEVFALSGDSRIRQLDPFAQDREFLRILKGKVLDQDTPVICHCYAGCLTETVRYLRSRGCRVSYTVAAHSVDASRREHLAACGQFPYPHLNDASLFRHYTAGYIESDLVIVPSAHSLQTVTDQGRQGDVVVIPHGVTIKTDRPPADAPGRFTVGYLGAIGPDKGLRHLFAAWGLAGMRDARLVVAGRDSLHPSLIEMYRAAGGGSVTFRGWVEDVDDFYDEISLYVQPSVTEGFGIEVLEAYARGRPVVCSTGAGASDLVPPEWRCRPADPASLAGAIRAGRKAVESGIGSDHWLAIAKQNAWHRIAELYYQAWDRMVDQS